MGDEESGFPIEMPEMPQMPEMPDMPDIPDSPAEVVEAAGSAFAKVKDFFGLEDEDEDDGSPCGKFCGSLICCLFIAPLLIFISTFMIGCNEKEYVCETKAIEEASGTVTSVGCESANAGSGQLVFFTCELDRSALTTYSLDGDLSGTTIAAVGIQVVSEMMQCVETTSTTTTKSSKKGKSTKKTTYSYAMAWSDSLVDDSKFVEKTGASFKENCGTGTTNPSTWPTWAPSKLNEKATTAKVGAFTVTGDHLRAISIDTAYDVAAPKYDAPATTTKTTTTTTTRTLTSTTTRTSTSTVTATARRLQSSNETETETAGVPRKWEKVGGVLMTKAARTNAASTKAVGSEIGDFRVQVLTEDPALTTFTVVGQNSGGRINEWKASSSWGCGGNTLTTMKAGTWSEEEMFLHLQAGADAVKWIVRFLGFFFIWFALSRCAMPCGAVADCIPFIGDSLESFIQTIACIVTCCPAVLCTVGVASIVYVFMRPHVGIPMLITFLIFAGCFAFYRFKKAEKKKAKLEAQKSGSGEAAPPPITVGSSASKRSKVDTE